MTREEESYFAMALKTQNFYTKNTAAMTAIPALAGFYSQLNTLINSLVTADTGSRADLTGFAMDKAVKRKNVEALSLKISNAVASLVAVNNHLILKKRADFPTSTWYAISEDELVTQATIVRDLGQTNAATDVTALTTALTAFVDVITNPSLAADQRKNDNKKIPKVINQIRTLFNNKLGVVMRSYKISDVNLYSLYKSARTIDINGSSSQPTLVKEILPGIVQAVYHADSYEDDTFYTIQNIGNQAVAFSLSTTDITEVPEPIVLLGVETRSRLAENLATSGTYFIVKNMEMKQLQ